MENIDQKPKLGVSGYRGIWGKDLNEEITFEYALAFAKMIKERGGTKILLGRDARPTGSLMLKAVKSALKKENLQYEYAGIIPTPSVLMLVKKLSFDGGMMITASHNPKEYNGLKFIVKGGFLAFLSEIKEIQKKKDNFGKEVKYLENTKKEEEQENFDNAKFRKYT